MLEPRLAGEKESSWSRRLRGGVGVLAASAGRGSRLSAVFSTSNLLFGEEGGLLPAGLSASLLEKAEI